MTKTEVVAGKNTRYTVSLDRPLKFLTSRQIQQIDEALARVGPFAEVRLVKNRGKLRFIQKLESESLLGPSTPPQPDC
jgi:hypothetical protein